MRLALELHKIAKREAFSVYSLPYRCYYDYLRNRAKNPSDRLMLNPCWPSPGYPIDKVIRVEKSEFVIPENESGSRTLEDLFCYQNLKPEIREQVDLIRKRFCPWDDGEIFNDTWKKYFLKYLQGYDFNTFGCFDFFGATPGELPPEYGLVDDSQITLLVTVYSRLQNEYSKDKDRYSYEEPADREEYHYLYQNEPFTLARTKEDIDNEIENAKLLNRPMSGAEIAALYKRYGIE